MIWPRSLPTVLGHYELPSATENRKQYEFTAQQRDNRSNAPWRSMHSLLRHESNDVRTCGVPHTPSVSSG